MTMNDEPKAMAEIRKIREELSEELSKLTPEERMAFIKQGAEELEQKFGFKLKRQKMKMANPV